MTSDAAPESPSIDYLYDFVYLDRPRANSYLAQLVDEGVITSAKTSSSSGESVDSQVKIGLAGNGVTNVDKANFSSSLERQYDATWSSLVGTIHKLDEVGYIQFDIETANLGTLVMISGGLEILDIRMLREIWPLFSDEMVKNSGNKNNANAKKEAVKITGFLSKLPHAIQMSIKGEGYGEAWATLDPASLIINSDDFAFKHGASISGVWHVIGVLDAQPDIDGEIPVAYSSNDLKNGMLQMLTMMRAWFGRPAGAYGITPVAVFRTISKPS